MKLTKNFTLEELTKTSQPYDNTPNEKIEISLKKLCEYILQPLRDAWGDTIIVTSGYRCEKVNKAVGGASNSDHKYGNAADIKTKSDKPSDNKKLFDLAVKMMKEGKLKNVKQIIDEYAYNWVHISFQDGRSNKRNQILHIK